MSNQNTTDRKDRATGGDVSKGEYMQLPLIEMTNWDLFNNTEASDSESGEMEDIDD